MNWKIVSLLLMTSCSSDKATTEMLPPDGYTVPDKFLNCPTGGKRPGELPTIRLPDDVEANRQAWKSFGLDESAGRRQCRSRLLEAAEWYQVKIDELLQQLKGKE